MPLLKKRPSQPSLADLDGGRLAAAVSAMRDTGHIVVALEKRHGESLREMQAAEAAVPMVAAGVATGDLEAGELPAARKRAAKLRDEHEGVERDLAEAVATLQALEELHGTSYIDAKKTAKLEYDKKVRAQTQRVATALEAALLENEKLRRIHHEIDVLGIRPCHPGLQAIPNFRPAVKEGAGTRAMKIVIESPMSRWLNEARDLGYNVQPKFPQ